MASRITSGFPRTTCPTFSLSRFERVRSSSRSSIAGSVIWVEFMRYAQRTVRCDWPNLGPSRYIYYKPSTHRFQRLDGCADEVRELRQFVDDQRLPEGSTRAGAAPNSWQVA